LRCLPAAFRTALASRAHGGHFRRKLTAWPDALTHLRVSPLPKAQPSRVQSTANPGPEPPEMLSSLPSTSARRSAFRTTSGVNMCACSCCAAEATMFGTNYLLTCAPCRRYARAGRGITQYCGFWSVSQSLLAVSFVPIALQPIRTVGQRRFLPAPRTTPRVPLLSLRHGGKGKFHWLACTQESS
jgi:hypothetical protein